LVVGTKPIRGKDGDMGFLREDLHGKELELQRRDGLHEIQPPIQNDMEEDLLDNGALAITVVKSETQDIISKV